MSQRPQIDWRRGLTVTGRDGTDRNRLWTVLYLVNARVSAEQRRNVAASDRLAAAIDRIEAANDRHTGAAERHAEAERRPSRHLDELQARSLRPLRR